MTVGQANPLYLDCAILPDPRNPTSASYSVQVRVYGIEGEVLVDAILLVGNYGCCWVHGNRSHLDKEVLVVFGGIC